VYPARAGAALTEAHKYPGEIYPERSFLQMYCMCYTLCPEKRENSIFVHDFNKFKCIIVIFSKQHREGIAKLAIQLLSASLNQCCHFTLQNEMSYISLLHHNIKTDQLNDFTLSV